MTDHHIIIGLTGGIGSGKSSAAHIFAKKEIPVLDADFFSRNALETGTDCHYKTVELFGRECLNSDGSINRKYVAELVFSDISLREQLNAIIHPFVQTMLIDETKRLRSRFVVWEVPLLFESGFDQECDVTVAVLCSEKIRIRRIMERDHVSRKQAKSRIDAQLTDRQRKEKADYTIRNEGDLEQLEKKVISLLEQLEAQYE